MSGRVGNPTFRKLAVSGDAARSSGLTQAVSLPALSNNFFVQGALGADNSLVKMHDNGSGDSKYLQSTGVFIDDNNGITGVSGLSIVGSNSATSPVLLSLMTNATTPQGILPPVVDGTSIANIPNLGAAHNGLLVFNSQDRKLQFYDYNGGSGSWVNVGDGVSSNLSTPGSGTGFSNQIAIYGSNGNTFLAASDVSINNNKNLVVGGSVSIMHDENNNVNVFQIKSAVSNAPTGHDLPTFLQKSTGEVEINQKHGYNGEGGEYPVDILTLRRPTVPNEPNGFASRFTIQRYNAIAPGNDNGNGELLLSVTKDSSTGHDDYTNAMLWSAKNGGTNVSYGNFEVGQSGSAKNLTVWGATTLTGNANANGNITMNTNGTTASLKGLAVNESANFYSGVDMSGGNVGVGTSAVRSLTVGASGMASTLTVWGTTTAKGAITAEGGIAVNSITTTNTTQDLVVGASSDSGEITVNRTLRMASGKPILAITPNTDLVLGDTSAGSGKIVLNRNVSVENSSTLTVAGTSTLTGAVTANGGLTVGSNSNLSVTGTSTLSGAVTAQDNLSVTGTSTLTGNVTTTNNLSVGGNLSYATQSVIVYSTAQYTTATDAGTAGSSGGFYDNTTDSGNYVVKINTPFVKFNVGLDFTLNRILNVTNYSGSTLGNPIDGQVVHICNEAASNTLTLSQTGVEPNIHLGQNLILLGRDACVSFIYNSNRGLWYLLRDQI
jgi:hypothetical protein